MHTNVNILAEIGAIASVGMINTILCSKWRSHSIDSLSWDWNWLKI